MEHKSRQNREFCEKRQITLNKIYGWDVRNRDHVLGHKSVQRSKIRKESILDEQTHYKPTETFQYTNFYSCHPPGVKKGFIKGEALRLLRTNFSQITFERNSRNFHNRLLERGYPAAILSKYLSEVKFADRKTALQQRNKSARKKLVPFLTQYHPALPSLKKILMGKWHLI